MEIRHMRLSTAAIALAAVLPLLLLLNGTAIAQNAQVQGVINGRSGATMTVQSQGGNVVVLLNDFTTVEDVSGVFHARRKQMGVTALVPGLQVQVQATTTPRINLWPTSSSSTARICKPLLTFKRA